MGGHGSNRSSGGQGRHTKINAHCECDCCSRRKAGLDVTTGVVSEAQQYPQEALLDEEHHDWNAAQGEV